MELKGKRVLITGGAGLIGSHVADLLVDEGVGEIVVIDNFVRGRRENLATSLARMPIKIVEGDIGDRELVAKTMDGIDLVYHMAALRIIQCAEMPRLAVDVLVNGTYTILEAAVAAKVGKVVLSSSASVYGLADDFPTRENHPAWNNRTLYGAAKAFNEGLCRSFNDMYGMSYIALRYFNVYGPRMDIHGAYTEVFIRWMDRIAAGQPPLIFGNGQQTMDFIHVEDIARANIAAAKSEISDESFNIASGTETSLLELASALTKAMDREDLTPEFGPERKVNPVPRRLADVSKAAKMLGWKSQVTLDQGLRGLVKWWLGEKK